MTTNEPPVSGVAASGPGSRPSDGAASTGVSTVPASIPNAGVRPEHRYRCECCFERVFEHELLKAPSPFNDEIDLIACPHCREAEDLTLVCDYGDCFRPASSGNPMPDGGYVNRCWEHSPSNPKFVASGIEARRAATAQTGAVEDESPVGEAETPDP